MAMEGIMLVRIKPLGRRARKRSRPGTIGIISSVMAAHEAGIHATIPAAWRGEAAP